MLEDIPKLVELGALGLICFVLIFKGIDKMQKLTDSVNLLSGNLEKLTDCVGKLQSQNEFMQRRMEAVETRLTTLEELIRNELREIKFDIEHRRDFNDRLQRQI